MTPGRLKWKEFHELSQAERHYGSCFEAIDEVTNVHDFVNPFDGYRSYRRHGPLGLPQVFEHKCFELEGEELFVQDWSLLLSVFELERLYLASG